MNDKLESLSKRRLELWKETGSEHFAWQNSGPYHFLKMSPRSTVQHFFFQGNNKSPLKYFCLRFLELNREMQYKVNNRRLTKYCWRGVPMISMYLSGASRSFGKTWILLAPLNFFMWAKLEACLPIKGPANLDGKVRWILTGTWRKKKKKSQNRISCIHKMNKIKLFFCPRFIWNTQGRIFS